MRRVVCVLSLLLVHCRAGARQTAALPDADASDASDGRTLAGDVSLVLPQGWTAEDTASLPPFPQGWSLTAKFGGQAHRPQSEVPTPGLVMVFRLSSEEVWRAYVRDGGAADGTLTKTSEDRALLVARTPEPWASRDRTRYFVVRDAIVLFECEFLGESQQALCDKQFEGLELAPKDGSAFRFDAPRGWTRTPSPPGEIFTTDAKPGYRLTVATSKLPPNTSAASAFDRLKTSASPDAGPSASHRRFTHQGFPALEVTQVLPPREIETAMRLARFKARNGDTIVVACAGARFPAVDAACEGTLGSVELR